MPVDLRKGQFLVADPSLTDPNFEGSVILLCAHGEEGSFGLVLNRPTELTLDEVVDEPGDFEGKAMPLQWGGPVGLDRLHVLHGGPDTTPDSEALLEGVGFGAHLGVLAGLHKQGAAVRFFLGYAGWDEGQLEAEVEAGSWRAAPAQADQIFLPDFGRLWTQMMAKLDPAYSWMQHIPPDPWSN